MHACLVHPSMTRASRTAPAACWLRCAGRAARRQPRAGAPQRQPRRRPRGARRARPCARRTAPRWRAARAPPASATRWRSGSTTGSSATAWPARSRELDAFYARWPGTYVEDRLRNDWLLELGKRRDWVNFARDFPRFRMNDDREVTCYALLTQHLDGAGRARRGAQPPGSRSATSTTAATCWPARWSKARPVHAPTMSGRRRGCRSRPTGPRAARARGRLRRPAAARRRWPTCSTTRRADLARKRAPATPATPRELATLALMRLAANDPEVAAAQLRRALAAPAARAPGGLAWAGVGSRRR